MDTWRFDELAARFDRSSAMLSAGPVLSQAEYDDVLDMMLQWTAPMAGEQGLDVGTGTGNLAGLLTANGARMSAVDQSKEMLGICRKKHPLVSAKLGNALALPFADGSFSLIVSAFALHFMNGNQQLLALAEMDRVLKPNGRICLAGLMTEDGTSAEERDPAKQKRAINRSEMASWLKQRGYITIHYAVNPHVGVLYAVRKH